MPEIPRFYGVVIRMFMEPALPHHRPHFHAYYQEHAAVFTIDPVECVGGQLPRKQQRLVEAWAELHKNELAENWEQLQKGEPPRKIAPLA